MLHSDQGLLLQLILEHVFEVLESIYMQIQLSRGVSAPNPGVAQGSILLSCLDEEMVVK